MKVEFFYMVEYIGNIFEVKIIFVYLQHYFGGKACWPAT